MKLTAKGIRGLQLPDGKTDQLFWDDEIPGFGLRLRAGGSRSWVFQYALGEKQRRISLGTATAESLSSVKDTDGKVKLGIRDQAAQLHAKVKLGQDPASDKTEARKRASDTFEAITKKYLLAKKESTRPGTYSETERHILKHARPLNGLQVAKIARRDIAALIGTIKSNSGPVAANRVRSTLSDFFGWAMSQGLDDIENNPVINTNKYDESPRERVLDDHELRAIWKHAGEDHYGSIVKLLMLAGQRADEMASIRWHEIGTAIVPEKRITDTIKLPSFSIGAIELPGERTKNGRPHVVPLSEPAQVILAKHPQRVTNDGKLREFVFGVGQLGFSGWSRCKERLDRRVLKELREVAEKENDQKLLARLLKVESLMAQIAKAKGDEKKALSKQLNAIWWTHHDLRRTMDTIMNDRLGVLPHVVEAICNRVSSQASGKRGVAGVYNKALYLRERVEALTRWSEHVEAIVNGKTVDNVVSLRQAAVP
jgi:integrase